MFCCSKRSAQTLKRFIFAKTNKRWKYFRKSKPDFLFVFGANPDNYELLSLSRNGDPECKPDTQDFYFRVEKSLPKLREQTAGKWSGTRPKQDTETEIDAKEGRENQLTG